MMQVGQRALWLVGPNPRLCRITQIHGSDVDLEFGDGSERGRVPVSQLELQENYDPLPFEQGAQDSINPKGIDSQEGMGRF